MAAVWKKSPQTIRLIVSVETQDLASLRKNPRFHIKIGMAGVWYWLFATTNHESIHDYN